MRRWTRRLAFAIQFLTRYPLWANLKLRSSDYARSSFWFPLVGALVGAFSVLLAWMAHFSANSFVIASFAVLGSCWITGAFHIDGLADTADASAHHSSRSRLKAMKDSRVGVRGTIAIVLDLVCRTGLLVALLNQVELEQAYRLIVAVPVCGRMAIVAGGSIAKSAKPDGLGKLFIDGMGGGDFVRASLWALPLLYLACGLFSMAVLYGLSIAVGMIVVAIISAKLHGITGDSFGCVVEIAEIAVLAAMNAIQMLLVSGVLHLQ